MSSTDLDRSVSGAPAPRTMRRVAFASFVGTAIEYYDFYIYGTAAALVFPTVFFPDQTPELAAILSFATFGVAFFSRPVGAALFGHFGDRIGRKRTLVATLLIMGFSTIAVGLIPPAAAIGIAAPLLLVTLRFLQGFAVGGEWAGAALLSAEYAAPEKRGFYGMFTQLGVGAGLLMSNVMFLAIALTVDETGDAFLGWGWRIPFLFSAVLVAIALYVRLNIEETPVFRHEKETRAPARMPLKDLFRDQAPQMIFGAGCMIGVFGFSWLAIRTGFADLPARASWAQFYGIALLCGIGFTMSLFIGLLAFPASEALQDQTKIGVLAGSLLSGLCGWLLLRLAKPEDMRIAKG